MCARPECATRDNGVGDDSVMRDIERLRARPQGQTGGIARVPCTHQIAGIWRKKEIAILGGENGSGGRCEIVCASDTDENTSNIACPEFANELQEFVVHQLRPLSAAVMIAEFCLSPVSRRLVRARLIWRKRFDPRDVVEILL